MKIFSISVLEGTYNGKEYSNVFIYYESERVEKYIVKPLQHFKIKKRDLDAVMQDYNLKDYSDLIGKRFNKLYYDRYGNVNDIRFE